MNLLRKNWYDLGAFFSAIVCVYVFINHHRLTTYQLLMWLSLVSLFLHQLEEYRIVGTFPGMINCVMFKSKSPDRYPLNTNNSCFINVVLGWTTYFLAAIFAERVVWLGIATMLVSLGNTIAHTIIFNIKGKTFYNAGLATSWLLFVPCLYYFVTILHNNNLATYTDYAIGFTLGLILNILVLKLITWTANEHTAYVFYNRNLLPKDRK